MIEIDQIECGSIRDNLEVVYQAVKSIREGDFEGGITMLLLVEQHIVRTQEVKSVVHLLTPVRVLICQSIHSFEEKHRESKAA